MRHKSPEEFEILRGPFVTAYRQTCNVDQDHAIKPGEKVAVLQRVDNPMLPVSGVACHRCIRLMARAK